MEGRSRSTLLAATAAFFACAAAGCAPTITLQTAPEALSLDWQAPLGPEPGMPLPDNIGAAFASPELEAMILRARAANPEIGAAAARIVQARGQLGVARSAMQPVMTASLGLGASASRTDGAPGIADIGRPSVGLDIAYEVDLFGAGRAQRRSARARLAAAGWDRDAVSLAVEAEVARAFVQYAALAERIALLDRNLQHARELERIVNIRLREGVATRLETGLQAIQIRQLETEQLRLAEAQARTRNALAVLLGEEAPMFRARPAPFDAMRVPSLARVQPADLLVRRPDIRAAEARIAAASGDVDRARAAFLPRLTLTARGAAEAAGLGGPLGATYAIGAELLSAIFNRGRLRGELVTASGAQMESVELYRGVLLGALGEAENALTAVERSRERAALLDIIVSEAREAARLARLQFIEGETDLQWVMDAEQQLIQAEDARAVARQERLEAAIDLYRALGGAPRG